jgi:hypothetical protein
MQKPLLLIMSIRVFAWDADPVADPETYLYRQSENRGEAIVKEERGTFLILANGRRAVQLHPPLEILLERSARNYLTPFGRILNKLMDPPGLHYPVPAEGDHRLRWYHRFMTNTKQEENEPALAEPTLA